MRPKLIALALALVAALLVGGCAMMQTAKDVLCDPTEAQVNTAKNAASFLDWGSTMIGQPQVGAAITAAILVFNRVRPGLCVALDELEQALATVDEVDLIVAGQEAVEPTLKIIRPRKPKPDMTALRAALK